MPPRVQVTRKMILDVSFDIVRREGPEKLNARRIAECLGCSTQPVMYNFKTVDEIRKEVYQIADEYHTGYIMPDERTDREPMLALGLNYIRFGHEEPHLFRFLFQSNQFSGMNMDALIGDPQLSAVIGMIEKGMQCGEAEAQEKFLLFFVAAHGYASLLANNAMAYDEKLAMQILQTMYDNLVSFRKGQAL